MGRLSARRWWGGSAAAAARDDMKKLGSCPSLLHTQARRLALHQLHSVDRGPCQISKSF